jgi:hypothetical protein
VTPMEPNKKCISRKLYETTSPTSFSDYDEKTACLWKSNSLTKIKVLWLDLRSHTWLGLNLKIGRPLSRIVGAMGFIRHYGGDKDLVTEN